MCEPWTDIVLANFEKELIGIYLTSHPLGEHKLLIETFCTPLKQMNENPESLKGQDITIAGMITDIRQGKHKKRKPFCYYNRSKISAMPTNSRFLEKIT